MATQNTGGAPRETGKGRATRIPLNYFKSPNRLEKGKLTLTALALLCGGLFVAWGFVGPGGTSQYSRGPLIAKHADHTEIGNRCEACHVPFSPMSEANFMMKHPSAADANCTACHSDDPKKTGKASTTAYSHHEMASRSCAGCHRDHQGRDFNLKQMPESDCLHCHRDLKGHLKPGQTPRFENKVESFASHPPFRGNAGMSSKLNFNHKLHLNPARMYNRQLECDSCHNLKQGDLYAPAVNYDRHCKECHPLTFDADLFADAAQSKIFTLDHPTSYNPAALSNLESLVRGVYTGQIDKDPKRFMGGSGKPASRPLPGKLPSGLESGTSTITPELKATLVRDRTASAMRSLQGGAGCAECHVIENNVVQRVAITDTWFPHAKFSHEAHRTITKCVDCHSGTAESTVHPDMKLMPTVNKCQECHKKDGGKNAGRSDCMECHTYHPKK